MAKSAVPFTARRRLQFENGTPVRARSIGYEIALQHPKFKHR
jgi:hypothetical protein